MAEYAIEKLDTAFDDLCSMLPAQWEHTGDKEVDCRPNWNLYRQMDRSDALLLVIAREDGKPIGYMAAFVYPHPNAVQTKKASISTYYVEKGRVHVLSSMIDFILEQLAGREVFKIEAETNLIDSAARIWELKGFSPSKLVLGMKLKPKGMNHA